MGCNSHAACFPHHPACTPPTAPRLRSPAPLPRHAEPLRSWIDQLAAEAGLKYQATVERLQRERGLSVDSADFDS